MSFDASKLVLDDEATAEIEILDRSKKPTGIYITVYSRESDVFRRVLRRQQNRRLKAIGRRGVAPLTAEENEAESLDLLVAVTKGWRGMGWMGEEDVPFAPETAREIYGKVTLIRDQVDDAISDASLFQKS